ncbi:MAG: hypothetical protein ABW047_07305 [Nitrospiraceae bacterium]
MVGVLGLFTLGALIWVIAGMMATESEAERRRLSQSAALPSTSEDATSQAGRRRAA